MTGGAGNDTFIATAAATGGVATLGDSINGGAGTDTLTVISSLATGGGGAVAAITVSNVEIITYKQTSAQAVAAIATDGLDLSGVTASASGTSITNTSAVNSIVKGVGFIPTGYTISGGGALHALDLTAAAVAGTADTLNVTVTGGAVAATTLTVTNAAGTVAGGFETIALTSSGGTKNNVTLANASTGYKTLTIAGDTAVVVAGVDFGGTADTTGTVVTVTNTAGADVTFTDDDTVTATGGAGADRFAFGATLTTTDNVNGGTGTNTVAATTAAAFTTGLTLTNVNTLEVSTATTGGETLAMANVASARDVSLSDVAGGIANAANFTVTGLATGATVTIQTDNDADAGVVTFQLATPGGLADVLNLRFNANDTAGASATTSTVVTGYETLNITSSLATGQTTIAGAKTFTGMTGVQLQAITIAGAAAVTITANAGMVNLTSIDASTATGAIVLGVAGTALIHASDAATFKTGSANDSISFNTAADAILTIDAGTNAAAGDTLLIYGTQGTGTAKIDLSSATDQISQINGGANNAVKQIGFENVTSTLATNGLDITGSSGKNTITGSNGVDDLIRGGAGADTLNVGTTGVDTVIYDLSADVAAGVQLSNADTIAGFSNTTTASDLINIGGITLQSGNGTTLVTTLGVTSDGTFTTAAVNLDGATVTLVSANLVIRDTTASTTGAWTTQAHVDAYINGLVANAANITTAANTKILIAVDGSTANTFALFLYDEGTLDAGIQASEMTLIGIFTGNTFVTDVVAGIFI